MDQIAVTQSLLKLNVYHYILLYLPPCTSIYYSQLQLAIKILISFLQLQYDDLVTTTNASTEILMGANNERVQIPSLLPQTE